MRKFSAGSGPLCRDRPRSLQPTAIWSRAARCSASPTRSCFFPFRNGTFRNGKAVSKVRNVPQAINTSNMSFFDAQAPKRTSLVTSARWRRDGNSGSGVFDAGRKMPSNNGRSGASSGLGMLSIWFAINRAATRSARWRAWKSSRKPSRRP